MLNDLLIIKKIKEGDVKSFELMFREYYSPLLLYAVSIVRSHEVAEEIVQNLFYVLWRDREKLHIWQSLKSYLYKSIKNRSLQYCEHQEVREKYKEYIEVNTSLSGLSDSPQEVMEYRELEQLINITLEKMPERRLSIFRMHRYENKKYAEIANTLSISQKTVEAEMSKALQLLRKEIESYTRQL